MHFLCRSAIVARSLVISCPGIHPRHDFVHSIDNDVFFMMKLSSVPRSMIILAHRADSALEEHLSVWQPRLCLQSMIVTYYFLVHNVNGSNGSFICTSYS